MRLKIWFILNKNDLSSLEHVKSDEFYATKIQWKTGMSTDITIQKTENKEGIIVLSKFK